MYGFLKITFLDNIFMLKLTIMSGFLPQDSLYYIMSRVVNVSWIIINSESKNELMLRRNIMDDLEAEE